MLVADADTGVWQALFTLAASAFSALLFAIRWLAVAKEKQTAERIDELKEHCQRLQTTSDECLRDRESIRVEIVALRTKVANLK